MRVAIPGLRLVSEANTPGSWRPKHVRAQEQKGAVYMTLRGDPPPGPWSVTIVRVAPRRLDDDNLARSAKAVRDQVAAWLGCDDSPSAPVRWAYQQRRGKPKEYAVEITITTDHGSDLHAALRELRASPECQPVHQWAELVTETIERLMAREDER